MWSKPYNGVPQILLLINNVQIYVYRKGNEVDGGFSSFSSLSQEVAVSIFLESFLFIRLLPQDILKLYSSTRSQADHIMPELMSCHSGGPIHNAVMMVPHARIRAGVYKVACRLSHPV